MGFPSGGPLTGTFSTIIIILVTLNNNCCSLVFTSDHNHMYAQFSKIQKKVQFWEITLFASKAKFNVFEGVCCGGMEWEKIRTMMSLAFEVVLE